MLGFFAEALGAALGVDIGWRIVGKATAPHQAAPGPVASRPLLVPKTRVLFRRALALEVDLLLVMLASLEISLLGSPGPALQVLVACSALVLYRIVCEALFGATFAKAFFRLRVVREHRPLKWEWGVGFRRAVMRNTLLPVGLVLISFVLGLLVPLLSPGNRRIGDMAAGTQGAGEGSLLALRQQAALGGAGD